MSGWGDFNNYVGAISQTAGSMLGLLTNPEPPADTSVIRLLTEINGEIHGGLLPGIVQSAEINQLLEIERIKIRGRSGSGKLIEGWADAELRYTLRLTNDDFPDGLAGTIGALLSGDIAGFIEDLLEDDPAVVLAIQRLGIINQFAKTYDPDKNPAIWTIAEELANAHHVTKVIFQRFSSRRTSRLDVIDVDIDFLEFMPATVLYETGAASLPPPPDLEDPDTTNPLG